MVEWMARETEASKLPLPLPLPLSLTLALTLTLHPNPKASKRYLGARRNLAFRYNLLDHIGAVSSLRETVSPTYPG